MKNKSAIILMSLVLSLVSSCTKAKPYVGIYVYDISDTFINSLQSQIIKDLSDLYSCPLVADDAAGSQSIQNLQLVNDITSKKISAAVVNTVDRLASSAIVEKAENSDVPLVFVNREPLRSDLEIDKWSTNNCFYVGGNATSEGEEQAKIAEDILGPASTFIGSSYDKNKDGKLQIAFLKGELGHQDTEGRTNAVIAQLKKDGFDLSIVASPNCDWSRHKAYVATKGLFDSGIELMISNNDVMALGAVDAMMEKEKESNVSVGQYSKYFWPLVGCDGTAEGKAAIKYGYMLGTVLNDVQTQATIVTDILRHLLNGVSMPVYGTNVENSGNFFYVTGPKITQQLS
jgi:methyl-galactoside transport system substrate-binding protein